MTALTSRAVLTDQICVLVLMGEIDCANADEVSTTGLKMITDPAVSALTIDLSSVRFCGAAGLGALILIRNAALLRDKPLRLRSLSAAVERLLKLTALDIVLRIESPDG